MTTNAAADLARQTVPAKKDEKRRALGRGLESLLPGPRAVSSEPQVGGLGESSGESKIPRFARDDNALEREY